MMELSNLVSLLTFVSLGLGCDVVNWQNMTMEYRLYLSDIVVLGTDMERVNRTVTRNSGLPFDYVEDSRFRVICVFKNRGAEIPRDIVIEQVTPRTSCSGTDGKMMVGDTLIVALTRTDSGNFKWHEVNVIQSAVFPNTGQTIETLETICGLQNWTTPRGYTNTGCPAFLQPVGIECLLPGSGAVHQSFSFTLFMAMILSVCSFSYHIFI